MIYRKKQAKMRVKSRQPLRCMICCLFVLFGFALAFYFVWTFIIIPKSQTIIYSDLDVTNELYCVPRYHDSNQETGIMYTLSYCDGSSFCEKIYDPKDSSTSQSCNEDPGYIDDSYIGQYAFYDEYVQPKYSRYNQERQRGASFNMEACWFDESLNFGGFGECQADYQCQGNRECIDSKCQGDSGCIITEPVPEVIPEPPPPPPPPKPQGCGIIEEYNELGAFRCFSDSDCQGNRICKESTCDGHSGC